MTSQSSDINEEKTKVISKKRSSVLKKRKTGFFLFCIIVCVLPVITSYLYFEYSLTYNRVLSFPLDDAWIHLTFARNLAEYFSFSYFKNEIVTAGSTSPLYTVIVAIGFLFTQNEMMIGYVTGVIFFVLASFYFFKLNLKDFDNELLFCTLSCSVFILDPWINFIALSGMETTLFISLLILGSFLYKEGRAIPLGIVLGLIIWTRPDGFAFAAAVFIDHFICRSFTKDRLKVFSEKEIAKIFLIFACMTVMYFFMNYFLSGTLLPNTYKAKIAYFIDNASRMNFLTDKVWIYFTTASYGIIMFGFIISLLILFYNFLKNSYNQNTLYILFIFLFLFLYWYKLPVPNRFGRYLMPIIPFFIIVSISGYRSLLTIINLYLKRSAIIKIAGFLILFFILFITGKHYDNVREYYASQCKYIYERQVETAHWLKNNTKDSDIIATHDIGAIGFYSGRKITDVAGLITPELNDKINEDNYSEILTLYMREKGVTFTAFLREWYVIMNQKPVYTTPSRGKLEIMDVCKFNPNTSRVLSRQANRLYLGSKVYIEKQNAQMIISSMNKVLEVEPEYSPAYYDRAYGYYLLKNFTQYEKNLQDAIRINPDYNEALLSYGTYLTYTGNTQEAKLKFLKVLETDPSNEIALKNLNSLNAPR